MRVSDDTDDVYAILVDYPPLGAEGRSLFVLTYHVAVHSGNPMQVAPRTYTLLTLQLRRQSPATSVRVPRPRL